MRKQRAKAEMLETESRNFAFSRFFAAIPFRVFAPLR
jgi:hypothetical protein